MPLIGSCCCLQFVEACALVPQHQRLTHKFDYFPRVKLAGAASKAELDPQFRGMQDISGGYHCAQRTWGLRRQLRQSNPAFERSGLPV